MKAGEVKAEEAARDSALRETDLPSLAGRPAAESTRSGRSKTRCVAGSLPRRPSPPAMDPLAPKWGVEVSYFMHPAVAGAGYATELVRAAVHVGFEVHGFDAIAAFARAENAASIRVLTKCAFAFVCFEPELDRNHYRLTRARWEV